MANAERVDSSYTIGADSLTVTKGSDMILVDEAAVYDILYNAFLEENYTTFAYEPEIEEEAGINFIALSKEIYIAPENAKYDPETESVTEHKNGTNLNVRNARKLFESADAGQSIEIPFEHKEPEITKTIMEESLFRDELGSCTTSYSSSSYNRATNVELATAAINGTILQPGDVFSFNDVVGERTTARGYKGAAAYMGGETVTSIGGGICQVSSTLYASVLYADLEVVTRSNHGYSVSYLPLGIDATVSWGGPHFRFKNDTDYPIRIDAYASGGSLNVTLIGTKTNDNYIELESICTGVMPYETIEKEDKTLEPGERELKTSGYTGYTSVVYRYLYDKDGNLIERTLVSNDYYSKRDEVYLVGPKEEEVPTVTPTPTPTPEPEPEPEPTPDPEPTPNPEPIVPDPGTGTEVTE